MRNGRPDRQPTRLLRGNRSKASFSIRFRLDEAIPDDHPVRAIAAVLDLSWVRSELAPSTRKMGRPSVDPVLMIRMLVVGYVFAIRSERALCREVHCAPRDRCRASAPFDQKPPPIDG